MAYPEWVEKQRKKVVINKEYERVSDFSDKRSIVTNKRGKRGVIDTTGTAIIPFEYSIIKENGIYFFAGKDDENSDVYDYNGNLLGTLPVSPDSSSLEYERGSKLLAIREKSKWKLITPQKVITNAIYDSISIAANSIYAILKYGTQEALATEKGIIFDLGEYKYDYDCSNHEYIVIIADNHYAIANESGLLTDFYEGLYQSSLLSNDKVVTLHNNYYKYLMYDLETQQSYVGTTESEKLTEIGGYADTYTASLGDGTTRLLDGTQCLSIERVERLSETTDDYYFVYTSLDNKYGLFYHGQVVVPAEYDTAEEAIAAFGAYKIDSENGKPIVVYGNYKTGYTPVIQYYKDNLYFDSIIDVGSGYYACCYDETWYLVKAETE